MMRRAPFLAAFLVLLLAASASAQLTPWHHWTLLDPAPMDEIIGEASGETAWNSMVAMGGFNRDRPADEYGAADFQETRWIHDRLLEYGLDGVEVVRFPGGQVWDGVVGELWEVSPLRQKIASYQDLRAMLANGSTDADVEAELVWVGTGTPEELDGADVRGKVVVTAGSMGGVFRAAVGERGALGVVDVANGRPFFDATQIPWSGVGGRGGDPVEGFGFFVPPREAATLKARLLQGERIRVHALVDTEMRPYEMQDPVAHIRGTDPDAPEIILSAHLFEGYVKQGANDNISGSAAILEVARTLQTLIDQGRIPRPRRTIRFLWGPEFSGTGPWVQANAALMERTLADINMDMVGEWLSKNNAYMRLMRTTYGQPHFINDVVENYYRFVGESNDERIQNRSGFYKVPRRIVAPSGAEEPFYYSIETHYGSSDHEVFNDWGVQVPGVMMIAWPDQWYHTSGDRPDKADPTQLKRVVVIGAAAAYTVASADDDVATRLAGEIASNATRRLGHQLVMGQERLRDATAETLRERYQWARAHVRGTAMAERETLETVLHLAVPGGARADDDGAADDGADDGGLADYVGRMTAAVDAVEQAHLEVLQAHMEAVAARLGVSPADVRPTELERRAERLVPRQTDLVKRGGYTGWRTPLQAVGEEVRGRYPYRGIDTNEVQLLVDGRHSVMDIKTMMDAQGPEPADLQAILNYLEVLKAAGLVEM